MVYMVTPAASLYAEAFTAIGADLEAFGHSQEAGHSVHGRAVIYIVKVNIHVPMTHARSLRSTFDPV